MKKVKIKVYAYFFEDISMSESSSHAQKSSVSLETYFLVYHF